MKTLTILFEEPNVFKVLLEWPEKSPLYFTHYVCNGQVAETGQRAAELYREACEQSKANAIRIVNPEILESKAYIKKINNIFFDCWSRRYLNSGDIFQVEGFEYELNHEACDQGHYGFTTVILKLAKEEEPKHHKPLREHFEVDTDAGICLNTFRYIDALEKYIEEIEKLKK